MEFGEIMDCTAALALDGIPFMGSPLRIARPKEYQTPLGVGSRFAWNLIWIWRNPKF